MKNLSSKIGYGLGDMSSSMFWKIFSYYLPFFYSNIYGLTLKDAATLLLITKLWDAISDPIMGIIADRTNSKWGKYRPYLLWFAIPFALVGILTFYTPQSEYFLKKIWAYSTYILMMSIYTIVNVPYGAMLGVITNDSKEKTVYSSFRMFFAYGGGFLALAFYEPICNLIKGSLIVSDQTAWFYSMIVISIICMILFFLCFSMTKEHIKSENSNNSSSILTDIKHLISNKPWWTLLFAAISALLFNSIRGGAAAYYFKDYVGSACLFSNVIFTSAIFLSIGEIANMIGVVLAVPISRKIGKKNTYLLAMAVSLILSIAFFYSPINYFGYWYMLILQIIISIPAGITFPLLWSMYADVADYSELKYGTSSIGLIFSSSSMSQKFGGAFGSFLILMLLSAYGYDTSNDIISQSDSAIFGLKMLMSYIPALSCLFAIIAIIIYPLSTEKVDMIRLQLEKNKKNG